VDWGDGSASSGTVTGAAGLFHVSGSHTYSKGGEFPIMVEIFFADPYLVQITTSVALVVYIVNRPIMLKSVTFESDNTTMYQVHPNAFIPGHNGYVLNDDVSSQAYNPDQWTSQHQWPYAYVRHTTIKVKAVFVPQFRNFAAAQLQIKGTVQGANEAIGLPALPVKIQNGEYVFEQTGNNTFEDKATFYPSLAINFLSLAPGGTNWLSAGTSKNPIYLLYNYPIRYFNLEGILPQTVVDYGSEPGGATALDVLNSIWGHFVNANAKRIKDGQPIAYYRAWNCYQGNSFVRLIRTTDGACNSWAKFLVATILAQGLDDDPFLKSFKLATVTGKDQYKDFLVKEWAFLTPNDGLPHPFPAIYKYTDICKADAQNGGIPAWTDAGGNWHYDMPGPPFDEVLDWPGIPGQNTRNPASAFQFHTIVEINNSFYDPSYGGRPYTNLKNMQDRVIEAYFIPSDFQGQPDILISKQVTPQWNDLYLQAAYSNLLGPIP
jgi:hypothetical protein